MSKLIAVFPSADFIAQTRFSSTEETRYYLRGVFVDVVNNRLVATDGHRLGMLAMGETMWTDKDAASFILSSDKAIINACKGSTRAATWIYCYDDHVDVVEISAHMSPAAEDMRSATHDVSRTIPAKTAYVDGTYPDYTHVMPNPHNVSGEPILSFNARYMAAFVNPLDKGKAMVSVLSDGAISPALVFNSDERFVGVLMPIRGLGVSEMRNRAADKLGAPAPELAAAA